MLFGKDSATIRPGGAARIAEAVATIRTRDPGRVRIVGYTDDLGSAEHGLVLSRQRATAVAAIVGRELPAARYPLVVVGRGEADPGGPEHLRGEPAPEPTGGDHVRVRLSSPSGAVGSGAVTDGLA